MSKVSVQLAAAEDRLREDGMTEEMWGRVVTIPGLSKKVVSCVMAATMPSFCFRKGFKQDMRGKEWKLTRDVVGDEGIFKPFLVEFLPAGTVCVDGETMLKYASAYEDCGGQGHGEAMAQDPDRIPTEYEKFSIILPGNIWEDDENYQNVPILVRHDGVWGVSFRRFRRGFNQNFRILRVVNSDE